MKNTCLLISQEIKNDKDNNSMSIINIIETIKLIGPKNDGRIKMINLEYIISSFWLDSRINKERKFNFLIEVIDPNGKKIQEFKQDSRLEKGKSRLRVLFNVRGFGFTDEGDYIFLMKYKEEDNKNYKQALEYSINLSFRE
jgi:hypothetical protein